MPSPRSLFCQHFRIDSAKIPLWWLLVVPFVLQTVGAVALVGYLSYRSGQQAVEKLAHQLMKNVGQQVTQELDRYLQNAHKFNQCQIAAIESGAINLQNLDRLHRYLILQHRQNEELTTLLFGTPQGDLRVSHRVSKRDYGVTTRLKPGELPFEAAISKPSNPAINHTYSVNQAGDLGRYLETVKNIDVRDRPWYRQAVKTGKAGWTNPFQISSTNILALNAYTPFYNKSRQLLGVFAVNISLNQLSDFLRRLEVGKSGKVFIIERNGLLIADSTAEPSYSVSGKPDLSGIAEPGTLKFKRRLPWETPHPAIQDSYQYLQTKFSNLTTIKSPPALNFQIRGNRYFLTVYPYQDKYGLDWLVVTVIPESDFMAEIQNNRRTTLLLCLLTLLMAIASGLILANRFTTRITRLNQISQQLASGDLTQRLPANSLIIEVRELAQSFNLMADRLEESFDRLQNCLEESEKKFTTVFRTSPQPAWIATLAEGRCIEMNDSFSKVLGYSRTEAIGKTCVEMQLWTDLADLQHFRASLLQYGRIDNFEVRFRTKSGEIKTVLLFAKVTRLDEQDCVIGVLSDISHRKQAEIALQASETRFRTVVEYAPDVFVIYDRDLRLQYVNERALKRTGWTYETFIGKRDEDLFPKEVTSTYLPILLRTVETRTFGSGEATIQLPGQEPYTILVKYVPILDRQGEIQQIFGITTDITERKQAEIALQTSETRLRLALKASGAIAWERDLETDEILFTNTVTPYIPENIPYQQAMALVHPDDRVALDQANQEAIAQRGTFQIEHRVATSLQNPEWRWFQVSARVLTDSTGKPTRIIGMSVDITDRHQLDTMKDEFVSIVSHELRTPLTSIYGSLNLLKSGVLKNKPDKAQQMLEIAVNNTDRLVRLVNDILNLQRLDSGQVPLIKEICQVSELIEQAVESVKAIADQANITLEWVPLSVTVSASGDEIVQTLINLLSNAIKFSPANSTISMKADVTNNLDLRILAKFPDLKETILSNCILFSITDRGRGIPADKLELIFGRFQQVDVSDSREKGGTGLGLAICKNIVQRHQGLIWVESAIGQGSTFYFTLPMED
ncbi:PAS domain S-box protein [Floridanema aerugineum]|uniref:histidine kinase n=1 Tax=Floridaenema aerugineum BLCC-F46 TaxID=3153654 RepID=A0ABV4XEE5_9CYAN